MTTRAQSDDDEDVIIVNTLRPLRLAQISTLDITIPEGSCHLIILRWIQY